MNNQTKQVAIQPPEVLQRLRSEQARQMLSQRPHPEAKLGETDLLVEIQVRVSAADSREFTISHQQPLAGALHPDFSSLAANALAEAFKASAEATRIKYQITFAPPLPKSRRVGDDFSLGEIDEGEAV